MEETSIKDRILEEIAQTEKQISDYKESIKPIAPDKAIGRLSRMDAIANKSVMEFSFNKAENRLNKLRHVLSKVNSPDFGICIECGNAIPVGRLLIIPESQHCVNCAE
ncbi:TraR/DksA family transcriptional regulator [Thermodesulfobacteriota bacterium]